MLDGWSAALAVPGGMLLGIALTSRLVDVAEVPLADDTTAPPPEAEKCVAVGAAWARGTAAAVFFLMALVTFRASAFDVHGRRELVADSRYWLEPVVFALACVAAGTVILARHPSRRTSQKNQKAIVAIAVAVVIALAAGVVILFSSPLAVGEPLGAFTVVAVFFAASVLLLAGLTLLGLTMGRDYRVPSLFRALHLRRFPTVSFLAVWFILASVVSMVDRSGYHDVRPLRSSDKPPSNVTLDDVWVRWRNRNVEPVQDASKQRPAVPLVFVSASGGGLRAAAWTSLAMDCVFERLSVDESGDARCAAEKDPSHTASGRSDLIFAASGTSGGGLGLVEYDAFLRNLEPGEDTSTDWVEDRLRHDFVAPAVAGMLFRDLPRAFLGFDASDRASLLEQAWERPWRDHGDALADGLHESWNPDPDPDERVRPVLLLNGTSVEDRCRFMTSVLAASVQGETAPTDNDCLQLNAYGAEAGHSASGPDDFLTATTELNDFLCPEADVRMSTAALLSARFAFVTPSGRIKSSECAPVGKNAVTFVVDGGYFDNSGAVTVLDLWRALAPRIVRYNQNYASSCIVPVFVQLDNDFEIEPVPGLDERPRELLVPPQVIFGGIGSHETAARAEAAATFDRSAALAGQTVKDGNRPMHHFWVRLSPRAHPGPQPPLGWALSEYSFDDMRAELNADHNREERNLLARLLGNDLSCSVRRRPVARITVVMHERSQRVTLSSARSVAPEGHRITARKWEIDGADKGNAPKIDPILRPRRKPYRVELTIRAGSNRKGRTEVTISRLPSTFLFDTGEAHLRDDAPHRLAGLRRELAGAARVYIDGHADSRGPPEANAFLSLGRGQMVRDALLEGWPGPGPLPAEVRLWRKLPNRQGPLR